MGCFTVFRSKKKKSERPTSTNFIKPQQCTPAVLPEPQIQNLRSLQSAPPSFKARAAAPIQPVNQNTYSRSRTFSAPSRLNMPERDALSSIEKVEQEDPHSQYVLRKELRSPSPQPLPLPSCHSDTILKNTANFKAQISTSDLLSFSGPLPLPPLGGLKNFSYEEIAAACQQFSPDLCMSEGLSSVIYKASFGDDNTASKKLEATVTRLFSSTQGIKELISEVLPFCMKKGLFRQCTMISLLPTFK